MSRTRRRQIPAAEWIASLISGVIVLGTIGFLAVEALRRDDQAPALTVSVVQVRKSAGSFVVDVDVRNLSRGAAADVHLAGSDVGSDGRYVQVQARLDYVPGFSTRRASLVFESDPGGAPAIRIVGYGMP
jgi:uncharacterized protein (TIGR02588 family)